MRTAPVKSNDIKRDWFVVDAANQTLGRLSSKIASILRGKKRALVRLQKKAFFDSRF